MARSGQAGFFLNTSRKVHVFCCKCCFGVEFLCHHTLLVLLPSGARFSESKELPGLVGVVLVPVLPEVSLSALLSSCSKNKI